MKKLLAFLLLSCAFGTSAREYTIDIDAAEVVAKTRRADLMGINIAVYNSPEDLEKAIDGPIGDLAVGLVRMPGGSVSDKYYWNGNGVVSGGVVDQSKYDAPFWQIDYSAYQPGFAVDNHDWFEADPGFVRMDAKTMHELTRTHPLARNLVTVNLGSGTPEMAAEWVRWANIENKWGVEYWELGNELNGEWETGHVRPDGSRMTAGKYAELFVEFAKAMKAVDPTIKVGGPSCDVEHHEDYFEPLLRDAGEYVDFITLHHYSLRSSLSPENELFDGLANLAPVMDHLAKLVEKYPSERKDEIEFSITEWNSKLPKDRDAYRLFNGLWFSAWIGEMFKEGVDSATVWDLFSGADNGHGLLVEQDGEYVPTGRYWAFWLWSHYMADTLVKSTVADNEDLHVYATRADDALYVMVMNQSRTESYPVSLGIKASKVWKTGKEITLSTREYFWNPYAGRADWNSGPSIESRTAADMRKTVIPPYCVKVFQFGGSKAGGRTTSGAGVGTPELRVLLPESGFADLPVEGWVRAFRKGSDEPYAEDLDGIHLSVEGPSRISVSDVALSGAATRFVLEPTGSGEVVIKATGKGLSARKAIQFKPVSLEKKIVWNFESGGIDEPVESAYPHAVVKVAGTGNHAMRIDFPGTVVQPPDNHILDIKAYPRGVPKSRIGGVVFDILLPDGLELDDPAAHLQAVLQSTGAYWIPLGQVSLSDAQGQWRTVRMEVSDKNFLQVMDRAFAMLFLVSAEQPVSGSIYLDNIGFMLRPE